VTAENRRDNVFYALSVWSQMIASPTVRSRAPKIGSSYSCVGRQLGGHVSHIPSLSTLVDHGEKGECAAVTQVSREGLMLGR
jgi:hypothetical protein